MTYSVRLILDLTARDGDGEITIRTVEPELTIWKLTLGVRPGQSLNFNVSLPAEISDILHGLQ